MGSGAHSIHHHPAWFGVVLGTVAVWSIVAVRTLRLLRRASV